MFCVDVGLFLLRCRHLQEGIPGKGDDFVDFRLKVVELIKDVVFIVGSTSVFAQVSQVIFEVKVGVGCKVSQVTFEVKGGS